MPWSQDAKIQSLRFKYNAAFAGHQAATKAVFDARAGGNTPPAGLLETEDAARAALDRARDELYAAMAAIVGPSEV